MRTIEQQRAANALKRVNELIGRSGAFKKRYRSYVDRLGPAIVMNGLGQALATELAGAGSRNSDPEKAHHELYISLQLWLCRQSGGVYPGGRDLLQAMMENDESGYIQAQAEALSWLEWHKKCCRSSLPKGEENPE